MAQLKDLIVNGVARIVGDLYGTTQIYEGGTALVDKYAAKSHTHTITPTVTDGVFDLTGTAGSNGFSLSFAPYAAQQSKLSFDTSTTAPARTDRLNLNGYLYATKLYSGGTEVSVSGHTHTITANVTDGIFDLTGTNGSNAVTYAVAPYSSQQSKLSFDTSSTAPTRTDRLNLNGYLYATKLYSGGTEVSVSGHSHTITAGATDGIFDITGTNGTNGVTYAFAPYSAQQSKLSFDTSTTAPTRTDRLNLNGELHATKLYCGDNQVRSTQKKTYTGLIGTANSTAKAAYYFGKIIPDDYNRTWSIEYMLTINAAGENRCSAWARNTISGFQSANGAYAVFNQIANTSYYPAYYHNLYKATATGAPTYGHLLGVDMVSSWNRTTAANARTVTLEILNCDNCTFTFFDSACLYENAPGTGSTNYSGLWQLNFTTNGLQETSDINETYRTSWYYYQPKAYAIFYRNKLLFTRKDSEHTILPVNSVSSSSDADLGTSKTLTTESFDPLGPIFCWSSGSSSVAANARPAEGTLFTAWLVDLRYSFNVANNSTYCLTAYQPIYIKTTPQSDGSVKLDTTTPLVQSLPSTEDGKLYIYLGQARGADTYPYRCEIHEYHPVYYYKNGSIYQYTNTEPGASIVQDSVTNVLTIS